MELKTKKRYISLRAYTRFIGTFKGRFATVFLLFVVADALLAVLPLFVGQFVAALAEPPLSSARVYALVGVLIALSVGHDMAWRGGEWTYRSLLNSKLYEFESTIFQAVVSKPYPYFIDKFTGKVSSYITGISRDFREFVEALCYQYADLVIKLPTLAIIMFTVNVYTGVIFVVSILLMLVVGKKLVKYNVESERKLTDLTSSLDGYVIDVIANFVSVKAFRRERKEVSAVLGKREQVVAASSRSMMWDIIFWGAMSIGVRWIIWPVTILVNVYLFLHGAINLAQITTFMSTLLIFTDFVWMVIWNVSQFNVKLGRIEESYRYLFGEENVIVKTHEIDAPSRLRFDDTLELRNLQFAYPDKMDESVLREISLAIKKNEKIGIVGASGSGKTTLIKLLLGYYELPKGMTLLDGKATDNRKLVDLIAYVPQDTPLFHRSIRENIAYGSDVDVSDEQVILAARRAHAHEFISHIQSGYEALVGERGIKLSMGQRQRIAIARAFLDEKPILVLDEATSALDSESEVLVQQALEDLWHDRTVIAIAHRLSTLRHMDRIVVMDKGVIIEQGTHQQLLEKKGRYHKLWQHQSGGVIVETENT